MNKEIELLNNKIDAQDKIINTQALEIARLNNLKTATDEAQEIIIDLQQRIDKAIEYIRETGLYCDYGDLCNQSATELLKILGDKK
ncbi:MAG: hypothetical protein IIZ40_04065 [Bacilli bacterium]|nr:hypothetical protein [Bacilli bacterium]